MHIEKLQQKDIEEAVKIIGIQNGVERESIARREFSAMFEPEVYPPTYIVVKEESVLVGIIGFQKMMFDPSIYALFWIHIRNEYQKKGYLRPLFNSVIDFIKLDNEAKILILSSEKKNCELYEKGFGFEKIFLREDGAVMAIHLF